jgi:hypothetical protein
MIRRLALGLARRYGDTPAWSTAYRVVDRALYLLADVHGFLYANDGVRLAREYARRREIDQEANAALADLDALVGSLSAEEKAQSPAGSVRRTGETVSLDVVVRALSRRVIETMELRAATQKPGRN